MADNDPKTEQAVRAADKGADSPTQKLQPTDPGAEPMRASRVMRGDVGKRQPGRHGPFDAFLPNRAVSKRTFAIIVAVEALIALLIWINSPFLVLPRPDEVFSALSRLWNSEGLGPELISSFKLNLLALFWSTIISLGLAYATVLPVMRPIVIAISKGRFLSLVGFSFVFMVVLGSAGTVKTWLMVLGVTVFYVTSMASVVATIPKGDFDHARTLQMSEWRVVWEVVILGTVDKAFEVLRQNAAIGWMMLTMVEGLVRSEGGVGVMILNEYKHFRMADVFAIQFVILAVGLFQDYLIGVARRLCCPYADLRMERK
jgi:NitT/TauT family transport system permease protein